MSVPPEFGLAAIRDELAHVHSSIANLHRSLASSGVGDAALEAELRLMWEQRDRLTTQVGIIVAGEILAGRSIQLTGPAADAAPSSPAAVVRRRAVVPEAAEVSAGASGRTGLLASILSELGTPESLRVVGDFLQTFERLRRATHRCDQWLDLPSRAQKHLVGAVVAWLRAIQSANDDFGRPLREPEIVDLISHLSQWSREHRPGWVNGLARGATPDSQSWRQDALYHLEALQGLVSPSTPRHRDPVAPIRDALGAGSASWAQALDDALDAGLSQTDPALVELFMPCAELLDPNRHFLLLERILERTDEVGVPDNAFETMDFVPVGWRWLSYTKGRHAMLLGGHPSADVASEIKEAFELAKVTWDPADHRRKDPILNRLASGAVDIVLLLSHAAARTLEGPVERACAASDTHYVVVEGGPTVRAVRASIEDDLPPAPAQEDAPTTHAEA
jgi:hypothetical protein